jgi:hypothetical protein
MVGKAGMEWRWSVNEEAVRPSSERHDHVAVGSSTVTDEREFGK